MITAALVSILAAAPASTLEVPPPAGAPLSQPHRKVGFAFEAGVPDGLGGSVVLRPVPALRFQLGGASNGFAAGVRGGVVFVPLQTFFRPTLSVHAGHFTEGDARGLVGRIGELPDPIGLLVSRVQYDYASAHLGLELGRANATSFFIRAGMSKVRARLPAVQAVARELIPGAELGRQTTTLNLTAPSVQLGFTFFVH